MRPPTELLSMALASSPAELRVRWRDGTCTSLDVGRWLARPTADELELLADLTGPVLDIGCGPGRHVAALCERGVETLGIDVLPQAVRAARRRGAPVVEGSVFDHVPRAGTWATILLLDGNVGIGGDPVALLRRAGELMAADGVALLELERPGVGLQRDDGRLETPHGHSARFAWGRVGADAVDALAARAGFAVTDVRAVGGRWFARVTPAASDAGRVAA